MDKDDANSELVISNLVKDKRNYLDSHRQNTSKKYVLGLDNKIIHQLELLGKGNDDSIEDVINALLCCPWYLRDSHTILMLFYLLKNNQLDDVMLFCSMYKKYMTEGDENLFEFISKAIEVEFRKKNISYDQLVGVHEMYKWRLPNKIKNTLEVAILSFETRHKELLNLFKSRVQLLNHAGDSKKVRKKVGRYKKVIHS